MPDVNDTTASAAGAPSGQPLDEQIARLIGELKDGWRPSAEAAIVAALRAGLNANARDIASLVTQCLAALKSLPLEAASQRSCEALMEITRYFHGAMDYRSGAVAAALGERHAIAIGDRDLQRLHLIGQGAHFAELNQLSIAVDKLSEAISLVSLPGNELELAKLYNNLGVVCMYSFQYALAESCFEHSSRLGPMAAPLTNRAWIALQMNDPETALRLLDGAREALGNGAMIVGNAIPAMQYIHLSSMRTSALVRLSRVEEAQAEAEHAAAIAEDSPGNAFVNRHARIATAVAACANDLDRGTALLETELAAAQLDGSPIGLVRQALAELAGAFERAGQPDRALQYLKQTLELNKASHLSQVHIARQLNAPLADDSAVALALHRASLEQEVSARIKALQDLAVTADLSAGHDDVHIFRRGALARLVAAALGWDDQRTEQLVLAARLANVGMAAIPDSIKKKGRGLNDGERAILLEHTTFGAQLIRAARVEALTMAAAAAESHHEHVDGSGVPHGLLGDRIPIEGRIAALCDSFASMTRPRPWREPLAVNAALKLIEGGRGTRFDAELTAVFAEAVRSAFWATDDWEAYLTQDGTQSPFARVYEVLTSSH